MISRAARVPASLFLSDVTSPGDWRVDTADAVPMGVTRDWSETGVFVECSVRPPVGTVIHISFVWGDETTRTPARVARHGDDGIGLAFVNPSLHFVQTLRLLLAEIGNE